MSEVLLHRPRATMDAARVCLAESGFFVLYEDKKRLERGDFEGLLERAKAFEKQHRRQLVVEEATLAFLLAVLFFAPDAHPWIPAIGIALGIGNVASLAQRLGRLKVLGRVLATAAGHAGGRGDREGGGEPASLARSGA